MSDVTKILDQIGEGDSAASEQLLPLVYEELRKLASAKLANEKPGQTLQATALVHDAYLRLIGSESEANWDSKGHFFAAAAESMRRILVDRARRKRTRKHGGHLARVELPDAASPDDSRAEELVALDAALSKLEEKDPVKAELVKLRYFAGLTIPEAAEALGIGVSTVDKYWAYSKSWLRTEIAKLQ